METQIFPRPHASYFVSNIERSIEFYSKFFEAAPVKVKEGYAKFLLEKPSLNISFIESTHEIQPRFIHFGIEVNDETELKRRLGNAMHHDLPVDVEKEVNCCYAKQDKFWVTDPDGYQWEVFRWMEDVDVNDPQHSTDDTLKEPCCA